MGNPPPGAPPPPPAGTAHTPPPGTLPPAKTAPVKMKLPALLMAKPGGPVPAPKIILSAVEGWGKTTTAAFAKTPAIICAPGETGYTTLFSQGLVPACQNTEVEDWNQFLALLESFIEMKELPFTTLVLDALGGFESMMHQHVCDRDFHGLWGDNGFMSYHKGYDKAVHDWLAMLARLEQLQRRGCMILLLSHVKVAEFRNPAGLNFDRYEADLHKKTWSPTHKWADAVFFGTYLTIVDKDKGKEVKKGKGVGGTERTLYTERCDSHDAKNRYAMPPRIDLGNVGRNKMWSTIRYYMYQYNEKES